MNVIAPTSAPLVVAVALIAPLTPAEAPPMLARLMSLPVIVSAESELVAPIAPASVTSPVPAVSDRSLAETEPQQLRPRDQAVLPGRQSPCLR